MYLSANFRHLKKWLMTEKGMTFYLFGMGFIALASFVFTIGIFSQWRALKSFSAGDDGRNFGRAVLKTNFGDIEIALRNRSSNAVDKFVTLSITGFYDQTRIHRIVKDFAIQGGDPYSRYLSRVNEWGHGGAGFVFADEIDPDDQMVEGIVALANNGPNTNSSQFFILTKDVTWLNGQHTIIGRVIRGMDVVMAIEKVPVGITGIPVSDVVIGEIILK